ncbi:peptidoglycan-binding domain-containing protein [Streptomyces rhizosphaerihabitans]|uniref:peptidoglycan-binding domain-containing protein n=1 Tax=Streptomyces rhizosphaerihabitans TaxID=1266770 RepID=UPI0021BFD8AF|nr:peptidoglycan-binding protein [Streptomyces rhizosphaerihabitans]MCT9004018.1 peptidoglycan-binding protein [Streptomyces rhizosphaerihabitans]
MTEPTGHVCPECAAHRAQDGTPFCGCARTASDALRDKRAAQAAAEDFNPLRIRPYVELGTENSGHTGGGLGPAEGTGGPGGPAGTAPGPWHAAPTAGEPWAAAEAGAWAAAETSAWTAAETGVWASEDASAHVGSHGAPASGGMPTGSAGTMGGFGEAHTMQVHGTDPRFHGGMPADGVEPTVSVYGTPPVGGAPMSPANGEDATASTMQLAAIPADATMRPALVPADAAPRSAPLPPEVTTPSAAMPADATMQLKALPSDARATDVRLSHGGSRGPKPGQEVSATGRPRRRRRTGVLAVTGVVVTVVAAAGVVSGLLSSDPHSRDEAQPKDVRTTAPDVLSDTASAVPSASASSTASTSSSPSASASASPSPSASASASDTSATPSSSATASATSARPSQTATAPGSAASTGGGGANVAAGPTLRRGDSGAEVTELQLRLSQLRMYMRKADGQFDRHLEDAVGWYQWARGITGDAPGVYGPATRASLESETAEP